jgi:hypothetical protein
MTRCRGENEERENRNGTEGEERRCSNARTMRRWNTCGEMREKGMGGICSEDGREIDER